MIYKEMIRYRKYQKIDRKKWNLFSPAIKSDDYILKFGDWFLFQHIEKNTISKPILALFIGYGVLDMAAEIVFVPIELPYKKVKKLSSNYSCFMVSEIDSVILWDDDINILGIWKSKPTITELKQSMSNKYE